MILKYEEVFEFELVFLGRFSFVRRDGGIGGSPGPERSCMLAIERDEWLPEGGRDRMGLASWDTSELVEPVELMVMALGRRTEGGDCAGLGMLV